MIVVDTPYREIVGSGRIESESVQVSESVRDDLGRDLGHFLGCKHHLLLTASLSVHIRMKLSSAVSNAIVESSGK